MYETLETLGVRTAVYLVFRMQIYTKQLYRVGQQSIDFYRQYVDPATVLMQQAHSSKRQHQHSI